MKTISNKRWALLGLVLGLVLGLGYVAGGVLAKNEPDHDGVLVLTFPDVSLNRECTVEVADDGVYASCLKDAAWGALRLLIRGGKGLISSGALSLKHTIIVTGQDNGKRPTFRGHVTVLK